MSTLTLTDLGSLLTKVGVYDFQSLCAHFPNAHPQSRPTDIYRLLLTNILANLTGCDATLIYESIQLPNTLPNGDLVLPVPRLRLKGPKPNVHAVELAASFPENQPLFQHPTASGIHLPFFFTPKSLSHLVLPYLFERHEAYGRDLTMGLDSSAPTERRKKIIIEFSSPNIAKEFHAGHLRSTIIGAYIANLYESMGWDVTKVNYLGDWGKQFGLLAVGWERFGSEQLLAQEPLKHLLDVYARINALFKPEEEESNKARAEGRDTSEIESRGLYAQRNAYFRRMETGDTDAIALWQRFRDISIDRYIETYARLSIDFDEYSGESQVKSTTVDAVESSLKGKGVYKEHDGSWIIDFEEYGFKGLGTAVVRGRTGSTTYLLRDVAAILEREVKYNFDKMIYVVSCEQDLYFKRVFRTLELMGRSDLAGRLQHVNFGKVLGMSSRLGNVQLLGDILDQSRDAMHDVMRRNTTKYAQVEDPEAVAESVGISAVMVQDMSGKRINNYPFDITRMTSFEGDTGPYLQYSHARVNSILRKAGLTRQEVAEHCLRHPTSLEEQFSDTPHCVNLLRLIAQYPDVTAAALRNLEPSTILTYLFRLTHQLSSCYDVVQVTGTNEGRDVMLSRAGLYEGARQVLENGMRLLDLTPVDRHVPRNSIGSLAFI
ncbi:uncharacterized protein G6M90_00g080760 [Metarhizium brunneum]|uniref:arginine--tRNA ligase n=1 Tax=Metarhizium brunneum TaxID=500148 RepID=A0A7D5V2L7_9HYPO